VPLKAAPSGSPHISRWSQINLTFLIILTRLPSVAVVSALNIFFPTLTERSTLIIKVVLVEENAVAASATLWHIIRCGGPVIVWQVTILWWFRQR
jgi:hypothetical protein